MNGKKARAMRLMTSTDLSSNGDGREIGNIQIGVKNIGIIDGINQDHRIEERPVMQLSTNENRYLYRQLKKVYTIKSYEPELRLRLVKDIKSIEGK